MEPLGLESNSGGGVGFTRNFSNVRSYLGDGKWRQEKQPPGPPWGKASPPPKSMAMFESSGQGVAVFSLTSGDSWNFGPHGRGLRDDPAAGPCMHVAPVVRVLLGRKSTFRYRYWLVVETETEISSQLDGLWTRYFGEKSSLVDR